MSHDFIFWVPVSVWKLFYMYFHQRPNLNLFYYDERKKRLRYLLLHILFFLEAFAIHLHAIFLQKIISVIIAIYSIASNEEFCITIIQLLQVWIALVSSWLIVQVNFMTFLGEKITHIYYTKPAKTYSGQTDPLILHWWRDLGPQIDSASIIVDSQVVTLQHCIFV